MIRGEQGTEVVTALFAVALGAIVINAATTCNPTIPSPATKFPDLWGSSPHKKTFLDCICALGWPLARVIDGAHPMHSIRLRMLSPTLHTDPTTCWGGFSTPGPRPCADSEPPSELNLTHGFRASTGSYIHYTALLLGTFQK